MNAGLLSSIAKEFDGKIGYGSDLAPVELVKTGFSSLDESIGGIPRGRIIEIFGGEGSGKTALALHLARKLGGPVLYGDADHGLSPYILQGINWGNDMHLLNANTLQEALGICRIAASGFAAVVLDTITAYPTNEDVRMSLDDFSRFERRNKTSRVMAHAVPVLLKRLYESNCTAIIVRQMRDKPGITYGPPDYPAGGRALAYFSALRLRTQRYEAIKGAREKIVGQKVRITVEKCKYGPSRVETIVDMIYRV